MRPSPLRLAAAALALAGAPLAAPFAAPLAAQSTAPAGHDAATHAAHMAAGDVRADLVAQLQDAESKMVALAEATPQEKYGWRPGAGVRSVSEVFMHMAGANYMIPGIAGVKQADGVKLDEGSERTVTDKAQVVDHLRKSFAYARQAVMQVPESELGTPVQLFGQPSTKRGVLVLMATHAHEHLGQSIAYARMNGIVPPWSRGGG